MAHPGTPVTVDWQPMPKFLLTRIAVSKSGNIYFSQSGGNTVRKVSTDGIIETIAGDGTQGFSGDGGLAVNAQLGNPTCIAVDDSENIYIQ